MMLNTLPVTLTPPGALAFDEPVRIKKPVRVLVTLLDSPLDSAIPVATATSSEETTGTELADVVSVDKPRSNGRRSQPPAPVWPRNHP